MIRASVPSLTRNLLVLESREAMLAIAPLLENLAERCGQPGAMHWLPYFLDEAVTRHRTPFLVLLLKPEEIEYRSLGSDEIEAAALLFEYRLCGLRTGVVATADAVGFNSVIAPKGMRAHVAAAASRALLDRGASVVLTTYESAGEPEPRGLLAGWPGVLWAERARQVGRMLRLKPTLDATLATLGKSTRFNLRYYRRRLEKELPCTFIADAAPLLQNTNLQALNSASLNPVEAGEFERRVACASTLPGSFLCGVRAVDGRWLSLVGGWRQGDTTVLYWQMNTAGFEKHSLGTVMRSFLLEHEIHRGARNLLIYGGTPHSMRHAFEEEPVQDLVVQRPGLRAAALHLAASLLARTTGALCRSNFLVETLSSPDLRWTTSGLLPARSAAAKSAISGTSAALQRGTGRAA